MRLGEDMGPVINAGAVERIHGYIDDAEQRGAKVLLDGRGATAPGERRPLGRPDDPRPRHAPTCRPAARRSSARCSRSSAPAPLEEAIAIENASPYGNAAGDLHHERRRRPLRACERVEAGMCGVNVGVPVPREPFAFGGWNDSQFGARRHHRLGRLPLLDPPAQGHHQVGRSRRTPPGCPEGACPMPHSEHTEDADDSQHHRRALQAAHDVVVVGERPGEPAADRARRGRVPLHARGPALPRLQQPADERQHRPRAPEGDRGDESRPTTALLFAHPGTATEVRARASASASPSSCPATSTRSSSRSAAPRRTRTRSGPRGCTPAGTRSSRATAATTAAPTPRMQLTGDPRRWANEPGDAGLRPRDGPEPLRLLASATTDEETTANNLTLPRGGHPVRGPAHHRGDVHRDGDRHQRHPAAAEGLAAGPARAARQARHPARSATRSWPASAAPASCSPSSTATSSPTS